MALLINAANPPGTNPPAVALDIRTLKQAIVDIFGLPDNTTISQAGFTFTSAGLTVVKFVDTAASPGTAGFLQRNGTNLEFHDGTAARVIYRASGTDVAVADGGTGLSAGTSGGVLYFSATGTLASSGALTANALIVGGGAGATPTSLSAATNGQIPIGRTGNTPSLATITAGANVAVTNGSGSITLAFTDRVLLSLYGIAVTTGTEYLGADNSTTESNVSLSCPVTGNVKAMRSHASASGNFTYTLVVATVDSALTHTTSSSANGSSTGTIAVTAGQSLSVKLTGAGSGENHMVTLSIEATA